MLVTSQFVVLNLPKTGSSFVRQVLKEIHARRRWRWGADRFLKELLLPREGALAGGRDQHGTWSQVPVAYRHLPVVSVIRSPYDKLLSAYRYRWWADHPPVDRETLVRRLPNFPDLSLDEFATLWDLAVERRLGGENPLGLGHQTVQFARFFFREPERAIRALSDDYVDGGAFERDMADVTFLRQERLNEELAGFLGRFRYSPAELELCRRHPRVNETADSATDPRALWTPTALEHVRSRERFLLRILGRRGLRYASPA